MPHSSRSFGACIAALGLVVALTACSGGKKHTTAQSVTSTTKPKVLGVKTSVLRVGAVDIQSAGPVKQIDTKTGKAVLNRAQEYINRAVFSPLKNGKIGKNFGALFDAGAKATAIGPDKAALTELSVGKVANLTTKATPVHLSALEGSFGETIYLATDFDLDIRGTTSAGTLRIARHVELTFAKSGTTWLVTAYRVQAVRKSKAGTTTTTATGGKKP
ncbi:MAG TPA: hypothetical protein VGP92_11375 [Acidimicrobiia bacterium]|jgi:hypothetical protein|nr:hypothetical protein [Acidimicrobiia bacterium]